MGRFANTFLARTAFGHKAAAFHRKPDRLLPRGTSSALDTLVALAAAAWGRRANLWYRFLGRQPQRVSLWYRF